MNIRAYLDGAQSGRLDLPLDAIDAGIVWEYRLARAVVALGLTLRERERMGARRPLASVTVVSHDPAVVELLRGRDNSDILGELNVKRMEVSSDDTALVDLAAKPNLKLLGKRLGGKLRAVSAGLQGLGQAELRAFAAGGPLTVEGEALQLLAHGGQCQHQSVVRAGLGAVDEAAGGHHRAQLLEHIFGVAFGGWEIVRQVERAFVGALQLVAATILIGSAVRHGRAIRRANEAVQRYEDTVKRAEGALGDVRESPAVRTASRETREALDVLQVTEGAWALHEVFYRGAKALVKSRFLKTTREACEKFKRIPTAVMNFVEGTRFTRAKHHAQKSPYRHLLKPKIGGLGIALATMGEQFESMLDVTIVYPHGTPTFWELLSGRLDAVLVRVQQRDIPAEVLGGDPVGDKAYRQRLTAWIEGLWVEKDEQIGRLLGGGADGG